MRQAGCQPHQVEFFRTLLDDYGRPHQVSVGKVHIIRARTRKRAVSAAIRRFERQKRLHQWTNLADCYCVDNGPARKGNQP